MVACLVGGLALALASVFVTRKVERGRGAMILLAFFLPTIFVTYLLFAGYLREKFHHGRSDASDLDGTCTLPISNGYFVWFFDETPWMAVIANRQSAVDNVINPQLKHVQRVALTGGKVYGVTGRSEMRDSPPDFFFTFDPSSGSIREFGTEDELRSNSPQLGELRRTEEVFNEAENQKRSQLFWPAVALAPFSFMGGTLIWRRQRLGLKPR